MPFLLPILPALIAGTGAVGGLIEGAQAGNRQQKALTQQEQIAQQEMADKQQIFDLLKPFFQQYLGAGSPFLSMIQRAGAEQNAQQFNNAAGQVRSTMQPTGLGFGPSGATAAAIGEVGTESAKNASSTFLQNLLNNEQLKFQAAQGLNATGQMAGSSQNQPNVGVQLPFQSTGSSLFGLSQVLQSILKNIPGATPSPTSPGGGTPVTPGGPPLPTTSNPPGWGIGLPPVTGAPTTTGFPA